MKRLSLLLLAVLLIGCIGGGEQPTVTPNISVTPEPSAIATPIPTPEPGGYTPAAVGETVERGDFLVEIVSVGKYSYISPFGEERDDYRVDMKIKNQASSAKEYRMAYHLFTGDTFYDSFWYSTMEQQNELGPGEEAEGYVVYDIGSATGPFQLYIQSMSTTAFDYFDVIGKNELDKVVAGLRMYETTCGASELGEGYLGSLLSEGACEKISAARDLYIYPSWVKDRVVIHRLKFKNSADHGVNVLIVDKIPEAFGFTANDVVYSKDPILLDDYHPAWLVHLSRNEIWKVDMNYTVFLDEVQISDMPAPVILTVEI